jgi:hypothetical protein
MVQNASVDTTERGEIDRVKLFQIDSTGSRCTDPTARDRVNPQVSAVSKEVTQFPGSSMLIGFTSFRTCLRSAAVSFGGRPSA